ncbi:MAG: glycosyltransferase family 4 protein [Sphingorhabdus sp.]
MRICSILTTLTSGGAEMLVTNLSACFAASGNESAVLTLSDAVQVGNSAEMEAAMADRIRFASGSVHSLSLRNRRNIFAGALAMRRTLAKLKPDIVHAHTARALPMLALAGVRTPIVLTHHNSKLSFPPKMFLLFDRIASAYIAISSECVDLCRQYGNRPVVHIPNAASPEFAATSPRNGIHHPPQILSVGAISDQKNYSALIAAADELKRKWPYADADRPRFRIAGNGPEIGNLRARVDQLGLADMVSFLGERSDIGALMGQTDIYLNCSKYEGMPVALIEAMAMALPIIATDVSGNRELVQNDINGKLVPLGETEAMADAIISLLGNPSGYAKMSAGAIESSSRFSIGHTADLHLALYRQLLTDTELTKGRRTKIARA